MVVESIEDFLNNLPEFGKLSLPIIKPNPLKIVFSYEKISSVVYGTADGKEPPLPFAESEVIHAKICDSKRLTSNEGDCKAVYEITVDLFDNKFEFNPGDTIGIVPHNRSSDVDLIITHLGLTDVDTDVYTLSVEEKGKVPSHVPIQSSIRHVLSHCLDLRSVLKKLFLLALSKYTKDEKERCILEFLCSKEGSTAYTCHILNKNLCILDIFTLFKTCKPPIEVLLLNLPRLLPRPYSIVNSRFKNKKRIKICFSVLPIKKGLTTGCMEDAILSLKSLEKQMKNLSIDKDYEDVSKIPIYLRKNISGFTMPSLNVPLILIGVGTGVAPFIGFLEAREYAKENDPEVLLADVWLFFGCRNPELDFIYKTELEEFVSRKVITKFSTAFSRIDGETKYIQDALRQNGKEVTEFINNGAAVFVCGDIKAIAADVKSILVKSFVEHHSLSEEDAINKIVQLEKDKRYCVDAWS